MMKKARVLLGIFLLLFVGSGVYQCFTLPDLSVLKTEYPVVKYRGPGLPPLVSFSARRPGNWVSLTEISKIAVNAILISEDWSFFSNPGYDVDEIKSAIQTDWEDGKFTRGASTITQQLIKNVFLTPDKNIWRKAKELYLASKVGGVVGKRRILETYLNIAEWGPGVFGIQAASEYYFQKQPSQLSAREGAFLAMLLPSPIRYGQSFRDRRLTDYARETVESILDKLVHAHHLTEEEKSAELARPLSFEAMPEAHAVPNSGAI